MRYDKKVLKRIKETRPKFLNSMIYKVRKNGLELNREEFIEKGLETRLKHQLTKKELLELFRYLKLVDYREKKFSISSEDLEILKNRKFSTIYYNVREIFNNNEKIEKFSMMKKYQYIARFKPSKVNIHEYGRRIEYMKAKRDHYENRRDRLVGKFEINRDPKFSINQAGKAIFSQDPKLLEELGHSDYKISKEIRRGKHIFNYYIKALPIKVIRSLQAYSKNHPHTIFKKIEKVSENEKIVRGYSEYISCKKAHYKRKVNLKICKNEKGNWYFSEIKELTNEEYREKLGKLKRSLVKSPKMRNIAHFYSILSLGEILKEIGAKSTSRHIGKKLEDINDLEDYEYYGNKLTLFLFPKRFDYEKMEISEDNNYSRMLKAKARSQNYSKEYFEKKTELELSLEKLENKLTKKHSELKRIKNKLSRLFSSKRSIKDRLRELRNIETDDLLSIAVGAVYSEIVKIEDDLKEIRGDIEKLKFFREKINEDIEDITVKLGFEKFKVSQDLEELREIEEAKMEEARSEYENLRKLVGETKTIDLTYSYHSDLMRPREFSNFHYGKKREMELNYNKKDLSKSNRRGFIGEGIQARKVGDYLIYGKFKESKERVKEIKEKLKGAVKSLKKGDDASSEFLLEGVKKNLERIEAIEDQIVRVSSACKNEKGKTRRVKRFGKFLCKSILEVSKKGIRNKLKIRNMREGAVKEELKEYEANGGDLEGYPRLFEWIEGIYENCIERTVSLY